MRGRKEDLNCFLCTHISWSNSSQSRSTSSRKIKSSNWLFSYSRGFTSRDFKMARGCHSMGPMKACSLLRGPIHIFSSFCCWIFARICARHRGAKVVYALLKLAGTRRHSVCSGRFRVIRQKSLNPIFFGKIRHLTSKIICFKHFAHRNCVKKRVNNVFFFKNMFRSERARLDMGRHSVWRERAKFKFSVEESNRNRRFEKRVGFSINYLRFIGIQKLRRKRQKQCKQKV